MSAFARWLLLGLAINLLPSSTRAQEWLEVRSPHFTVVSDAGEKTARQVARQLELMRGVLQAALPASRVDPGGRVIVVAAGNRASLQRLLPDSSEAAGRNHPDGIFQRGQDRYYLAVRLDVPSAQAEPLLFHEYFHLVAALNTRSLPVWLGEGLADFYSLTSIRDQQVWIGLPNAVYLELLRRGHLLPVRELFAVDRDSPYYTEKDKSPAFYAQSWLLTHYLLLADGGAHADSVPRLLDLLAQGVSEGKATQQVFADTSALDTALADYLQRASLPSLAVPAALPPLSAQAYPSRQLPAAESAALHGDFLLHTHHPQEALTLLQQALALEPDLAAPLESMGLLCLERNERAEAARWFARAVHTGGAGPLAHYYHAVLTAEAAKDSASLATAETHLRRAAEGLPEFAPAFAALAGIRLLRDTDLGEALRLARRAVELDPEDIGHHLFVGRVLMRMGQYEEARHVGEQALALTRNERDRRLATGFLENLAQYQRALREVERMDQELAKLGERKSETGLAAPGEEPELKVPATSQAALQQAYAWGTVVDVQCTPPAAMTIRLQGEAGDTSQFRAQNRNIVAYYISAGPPPRPFDPCRQLQGMFVGVVYKPVRNRSYHGEVLAIEMHPGHLAGVN